MSTQSSINRFNHDLKKGDKIEVLRNVHDEDVPVWFPATIIDSPSPSGTLHVKFNTLFVEKGGEEGRRKRKKVREYINVNDGVTRRIPPPEPHRRFVVGEEVEVLCKNGWRRGEVKDVWEDCKYTVVIGGSMELLVENRNVRAPDCKQDDGSRVLTPLEPQQENSSHQLISQPKKPLKLRIICSTPNSKHATFQKGAQVEVRSYEEGYHGGWYVATVVGPLGEDKFLVQYDTLTTDDEMQPLVETAYGSNIRPIPPIISREHRFKNLEEVDAWYNDGWWVGVVTKVLSRLKYVVYFWTSNEELEFLHSNLRSHQELVNGKWVASFLRPKLADNLKLEKMKLQTGSRSLLTGLLRGLKVEVAHGSGSYLSTWYPAVIIRPVPNGKYLVEYRTLTMNYVPELVKEVVDVQCIRPSPPIIQRACEFKPNDTVDAWDGCRWRIGQIKKTMEFKYEVYFWATNSMVELQHAYLRPHQDFINGVWFGSYDEKQ